MVFVARATGLWLLLLLRFVWCVVVGRKETRPPWARRARPQAPGPIGPGAFPNFVHGAVA